MALPAGVEIPEGGTAEGSGGGAADVSDGNAADEPGGDRDVSGGSSPDASDDDERTVSAVISVTVDPAVDIQALQALYDSSRDMEQGEYTQESWELFRAVLEEARATLEREESSQDQIDAAFRNLQLGIAGLRTAEEETSADKQALQELYDVNEERVNDNYTSASWNLFTRALSNAKSVLDGRNVTQAQVDAAFVLLETAANGLEKKPEDPKADLRTLFHICASVTNSGYTQQSWDNFIKAQAHARNILEKEDADQEDIRGAYDGLTGAFKDLKKLTADKGELQALYREYISMENTEYTEESFARLTAALTEAGEVLDREDAQQEDVDQAAGKVKNALKELVKRADKNALQRLYEELHDAANDGYTPESWSAFETALEKARAALDKGNASQAEVDEALRSLTDANNGLTKEGGEYPDPGPDPEPNPEPDFNGQGNNAIDRGMLKKLYQQAGAYAAEHYTRESFQAFDAARNYAKAVLDKENVSQYEVDWAQMDLQAKMDGLKKMDIAEAASGTAGTASCTTGSSAALEKSPATGDSADPVWPLAAAGAGIALVVGGIVLGIRKKEEQN